MDTVITKLVCAAKGSLPLAKLEVTFYGHKETMNQTLANQEKFVICLRNGDRTVVAKTKLCICKAKDCMGCNNLHLCKGFLFGNCQFDRGRRRCRFSHDLRSAYNTEHLRTHDLEALDREELCILLLQNDRTLLPPVCYDYNNGEGEYGRCQDGEYCTRLHICETYLSGACNCPRAHDFYEPHPHKTLQKRGIPNQLFGSLKSIYMNKEILRVSGNTGNRGNMGRQPQQKRTLLISDIHAVANNATDTADASAGTSKTWNQKKNIANTKDKMDICMYFIKGHCKHGERCFKTHHNLPYRWEVKEGQQWIALPDNEGIEEDFCNPNKSHSRGIQPVCFESMTHGLQSARRLSTISSVLQPTFILTTEWLWYWKDEFGNWNQYSTATSQHGLASITSSDLEHKFLADEAVVEFSAGSQSYTLCFTDMIQTNKQYGTKRPVRRRPKFVAAAEAQTIKTRRPMGTHSHFKDLPVHWDKTQIPETGYKRVQLQSSSGEFKEIEGLFRSTLRGFDIRQIERIQNKALWEVFQWQKTQMKKNNRGQDVTERKLFHGTDPKHIDAICLNNFDWRICGTHGTAYGKGSYFARDAKYSHSYTGDSSVKSMFISRILVGTYTKGCSNYLRPPSKDGGDTHFYDSCVDNISDPSIFVVFEKHQIYPEYLITYEEKISYSSPYYTRVTAAGAIPKPTLAPKPTTSSWTASAGVSFAPPVPRPRVTTPSPPSQSTYSTSSQSFQKKQNDSCVIS